MAKGPIKLANRSRSNRMFYDNLIKEIAICINVGDTAINRELELPSYRPMQGKSKDDIIHNSKTSVIGFDTPATMLPASVLDRIDGMLQEATRQNLTHYNSRRRISDIIKIHTDLTDCHKRFPALSGNSRQNRD